MFALYRRSHWVNAGMVFPSCVPNNEPSVEFDGGNPVTETVDSAGRSSANGLTQVLESLARAGRQFREVGPYLRFRSSVVLWRR